jgi:chromosome segregation ATPase
LREELQNEKELLEGTSQTGSLTPRPVTLPSLKSESQGRPSTTGQIRGSTQTSTVRKEKDLSERVEDMHYDILKQLEAREEIKRKQKLEMVPSVEYQRLEQCIKETEASIQKLAKHNEFLQGKISELEADLEDALETINAPQRDIKMLWKRANAFRVVQAAGHGKL